MDETLLEIINAIKTQDAGGPALDEAWLDKLVRRRNREMHDGARTVAKRRLLPAYLKMRAERPDVLAAWGVTEGDDVDAALVRLLRTKPRRTASGVATVSVLTKPWPCESDCLYCPNDVRMPKSYLSDEPACQRAERNYFDPYLQVAARLRVLADMGHVTDKVELIVLGGTWDDYPDEYRRWYIAEAFRALNEQGTKAGRASVAQREAFYATCGMENDAAALAAAVAGEQARVNAAGESYRDAFERLYGAGAAVRAAAIQHATWEDVEREHAANEQAGNRCVGLVVETRPDAITPESLTEARRLGCTKIQMGVQSLSDEVLSANERAADTGSVARAFGLLRLFGFKVHAHIMANLPGAAPEDDRRAYEAFMGDARFMPDEVKVYPCALVESARLTGLYACGAWRPYSEGELMDVLVADVLATPAHTRISRMIRDISSTDIIAGNKKTNLRQMVEARVRAAGAPVREMRLREIATDEVDVAALRLDERDYETTVSHEHFLQFVDDGDRLAAFLRLSLPKPDALSRLQDGCRRAGVDAPVRAGEAMIREVHVYGKVAALHGESAGAQHAGLGRRLVARACAIAREKGYAAVNVISAVGTRDYYRGLGFRDAGAYQRRRLD